MFGNDFIAFFFFFVHGTSVNSIFICRTLKERDITGRTLLHYAALMGYDGLASFLLEKNKELGEVADFNGLTRTLLLVCLLASVYHLFLCLFVGSSLTRDVSALHIAVEEGSKEVITTLVQADAPLLATDDAGETAVVRSSALALPCRFPIRCAVGACLWLPCRNS